MKTVLAAAVALAALSGAASAASLVWDPAEGVFVAAPAAANPANADAAVADLARYTVTGVAWNPAEGAFVATSVAAPGEASAVATHGATPGKRLPFLGDEGARATWGR